MPIRRWDPLADLLGLQEKMNRLFEESLASARLEPPGLGSGWAPLADAYETPDGFVVEVELPGVREEDLELRATDHELVVRGERRPEAQARPDRFYRMERNFGGFARAFAFAEAVDTEGVSARFDDGLLQVFLPKAARPRGKV